MELQSLDRIEQATRFGRPEMARLGVGILFLVAVIVYTGVNHASMPGGYLLIAAAVIGAYMAMNIGANDVANNVGPAVGSRALTLTGAIVIAAIFEAGGALIAGGDVVSTIKQGIIDPRAVADRDTFVWLMMAALLAAGIWLNVATACGAPVSTTHSIVGGVLGAGIAAGGWGIASWGTLGAIAASWVISPVLGGLIAAAFLYLIKRKITYQADMTEAAGRVVPLLLAVMTWAFVTYLGLKGLRQLVKLDFLQAALLGLGFAALTLVLVRSRIRKALLALENSKESINTLFTLPLVFAAALLSFAHGANDVANAVGPLAAITEAITHGAVAAKAAIPLWVMAVGALGISIGLALYGPKLIRTVGSEITQLDQMRAFCIAMAAALTVILASQLGLPVSSTHIAVGAVFGVGFLREHLKTSYAAMLDEIRAHHDGEDQATVDAFLRRFELASVEDKGMMLKQLKKHRADAELTKRERKSIRRVYKRDLVKRSALMRIVAAWLITVPLSAVMGAFLFFTIRGMLLP
ncbi:MAG: inorganic phosphate transporter [Ectothiorhodospiraceae bacterium]|nr:inorganic phosphate transporter [Chromatiales bacterium]MCP5154859.1 inorganic phosphate transporter [Ectothiorhodospiraceae bacterium]